MKYDIIGDDSAPVYFRINRDTGDIQLQASVNQDDETEYRVCMV